MVFLLILGLLFSSPSFAQTAETYRQHAIKLSRNKSWDQAIDSYRKALTLEPSDPITHYNLALALKSKGETRQAAEEFETRTAQAEVGRRTLRVRRDLVRAARLAAALRTAHGGRARCSECRGASPSGADLPGGKRSFGS